MRLEKGYIIVGQDTDDLTMPRDAAPDWAVTTAKPYFIGKPAIGFAETRHQSRQLVGFRLLNSIDRLPEESHLVIHDNAIVGRVTSVVRSAELEEVIGLAYVSPQQSQPGSTFQIKLDNDLEVTAQTVRTPFYDPQNLRQAL